MNNIIQSFFLSTTWSFLSSSYSTAFAPWSPILIMCLLLRNTRMYLSRATLHFRNSIMIVYEIISFNLKFPSKHPLKKFLKGLEFICDRKHNQKIKNKNYCGSQNNVLLINFDKVHHAFWLLHYYVLFSALACFSYGWS